MAPKSKVKKGSKVLKKPAAAHTVTVASGQGFAPISEPKTTPFDLQDFIGEMMGVLGVRRAQSPMTFVMSTACSGSGAPTLVLEKMVPFIKEMIACDSNRNLALINLVTLSFSH